MDQAAALLGTVVAGLASRLGVLSPSEVDLLVVHLCRGSRVQDAVTLAAALLARAAGSSEPLTGTDAYEFLRRDIPTLVENAGPSALRMLAGLLAEVAGYIAAVGPEPVPGARHDAFAFATSGLAELLRDLHTMADLGYLGVEGVDLVPIRRLPGLNLADQAAFNRELSGVRAAVERAAAHFKCWQIFSEEGGRFRA